MAQPCVLLKHGELAIKGRNRNIFERQLLRNLKHAVAEVDPNARIERRSGVAVVTASGPQQPLVDRLREVIGISVVQPGYRVPKNPEQAARMVVQMLRERYGGEAAKKFAIKARRRDKAFQMSSSQLAGFIGQRVCDEDLDLRVAEVHRPVQLVA
ncbi:MAG: THUMP domain-containing protein, partial [Saccharopolyspora rectivirgula]